MASYDRPISIENFATEVLLEIFSYLNPETQGKCRSVCVRWRDIIDDYSFGDDYWRFHCRNDFKNLYNITYDGQSPEISWQNLYRSLRLWSKLHMVTERCTDYPRECANGEIFGFQHQRYGHIGIHSRTGILYFDITYQTKPVVPAPSNHFRYAENEDIIVLLGRTTNLNITRKFLRSAYHQKDATFPSVKNFVLTDNAVYFVTLDNYVCVCNLTHILLQPFVLTKIDENVMSLGYENGYLHVMTFNNHVYTFFKDTLCYQYKSDNSYYRRTRLQRFPRHNDLMAHHQWKFKQSHSSDGIGDVNVLKIYGNKVHVGTSFGIINMPLHVLLSNQYSIMNRPLNLGHPLQVMTADRARMIAGPARMFADPPRMIADPARMIPGPAQIVADPALMISFFKQLQKQLLNKCPQMPM